MYVCVHLLCMCICSNMYLQVHAYLLMLQNWSSIRTSGKTPPARADHSACYLTGDKAVLMVVGGYGIPANGVLSDVWLLDVTDGLWSEVLHPHVINTGCGCMLICMVMCTQPAFVAQLVRTSNSVV